MSDWIDRTSLDAAIREDSHTTRLMLDLFQQLHPKLEEQLDAAISRNDFAGVRELAHILKTRLRLLHCSKLGDVAESIEYQASKGLGATIADDFQTLKEWISEAIEELGRLLEEISS